MDNRSIIIEVTDMTLGTSGLWLGTLTEANGTTTLVQSFLASAHGFMDNRSIIIEVTNMTLGTSGLWLGTRTGAGGIGTPLHTFLAADKVSMGIRTDN